MNNIFMQATEYILSPVSSILDAFLPLFIGLCLALAFSAPTIWLEKYLSRGLAILITYTSTLVILVALAYGFIILIIGSLPTGNVEETFKLIYQYLSQLPDNIAPNIEENFSKIVTALSDYTVTIFLGIVSSIYLLKDREFFIRLWHSFLSLILSQKIHGIVSEIGLEIVQVIQTFIKGAFIDSMIISFLSAAVLTFLGIDFAVIIGVLAGILNIIPYFGPFLGMVPAFLVAFFSDGLFIALTSVLSLFLIQQLDCNIIYPKIVGNSTGLHPLFVLLSVSIFGKFMGIGGMILAVPIAGIIQILIKKWAYR